jgi:hypothetical protein
VQPEAPRAPAARARLEQAQRTLAELDADVASLALEAVEGKPGAEKALTAHRGKIDGAQHLVSELRRAVDLGERLDRETAAVAAATARTEALAEFTKRMSAREKAMAKLLELGTAMAGTFAEFAELTLAAQMAAPAGTSIPQMAIGPNGMFGPAFGRCENLLLAELWRLAPQRSDGTRFVLPFAKPTNVLNLNPAKQPHGMDEFRAAHRAILANVSRQISELNDRAITAASKAA